MKIYAVAVLVLTEAICANALLSGLSASSYTQAGASSGSNGLLGGLLGGIVGPKGGLLSSVLDGSNGGVLGGLLGGSNGGLLGGVLGGSNGGLLSGVLGGQILGKLTANLGLENLNLSDLGNLTSVILNNRKLLGGLTGKGGLLSVVQGVLQKVLCLLKSVKVPVLTDLLAHLTQTDLMNLEKVCSAPGGSDVIPGLLDGLLSPNATLGGLLNSVNGKSAILSSLLSNGGLVGELLSGAGININDLLNKLACFLKSKGLDAVVQLLKHVTSTLQLATLDGLCQSDKGLFDYLIANVKLLTDRVLGAVGCAVDNGVSSWVPLAGIDNIETLIGGSCANGTLGDILKIVGPLLDPLIRYLKDKIGLNGIILDDLLRLIESTGLTNFEELKSFLFEIDCLLRITPLKVVAGLIESLTKAVLIKLAPALCSLGQLDSVILGLLSESTWLNFQAYLVVNGSLDLVAFQNLICLLRIYPVTEVSSMITSTADIAKFAQVYKCNNGLPTSSLFDDVKRYCINGLSTKCQTTLNTAVMSNSCKACSGTGCGELNGLLPQDVVTECNAECVACTNG